MNIKPAGSCDYDIVALGEIMLRLDPGEQRIHTTRSFNVWEGGGEYNVARGLRRCFGMRAAAATAFVDNAVGRLLEDFVLQGGVSVDHIKWYPHDGLGRSVRNGLNFTERGFGVRGALGCGDRGNTAATKLKPGDIDWEQIFGERGARWLHTGGIFAALSASAPEVVLEAVQCAKKHGTTVSYDLNYRPSLWEEFGGLARCQEVNREIAKSIDVMIGNLGHFNACLGLEVDWAKQQPGEAPSESVEAMIDEATRQFPNFKAIATTLRNDTTATVNDWGALCWHDGQLHQAQYRPGLEILDRVGGGDSFASGLIYGFMTSGDGAQAVDYGAAHGALAMTTPGDTSMASLQEVEALMQGASARIKR